MNILSRWCLGICCAGLFCAVVRVLAPQKHAGKILKLGTVLLTVLCFCTPLLKTDLSQLSAEVFNMNTSAYTYSTDTGLARGMEILIVNKLKTQGISPVRVTFDGNASPPVKVVLSREQGAAFYITQSIIRENFELESTVAVETQ